MSITRSELLADPIANYPLATVACFDPTRGDLPRRQLNGPRCRAFLERLVAADATSLLIAASTGHGHLRSVDELAEWFRSAAEAELGDTVLAALLRPDDGEKANADLLQLLDRAGYAIVYVRPGTDLPADASDQTVAENLRPLIAAAAELGFPVGIYSISDVSGVPLTAAAARILVEGPGGDHIVAAKITEADYEASTLAYLRDPGLTHLRIVQGWDPHLARALADGPKWDANGRQRVGVTSGPMSFAIFQYQAMLAAAATEDWAELDNLQAAVTSLFAAMQDDPHKFADLQRAKFVMGLGQPLTGEISAAQSERVLSTLEQLPRAADRHRLARSLDLMRDGPFHERLAKCETG